MLAVKTSVSNVMEQLDSAGLNYEIACMNAPEEIVLSGTAEDIDKVANQLGIGKIKCTKLEVPYAFHSAQVEAILQDFEIIASKVEFHPAQIPLISPTFGEVVVVNETIDAKYLCRHAREPVNFKAGLESASSDGHIQENTCWVEIGPRPLCLGMIKGTLGTQKLSLPSLRKDESPWTTSANSLAALHCEGLPVDWSEYHREFDDAHELLELPAPVWENKNYWLPYKNNWTLLKGDVPEDDGLPPKMRFKPTTTVHRILDEEFEDQSAKVTFQSNMHDPSLRNIVLGHLVNDAGLCPSSIFGDMAMTAADYILRRLKPDEDILMDVAEMAASKPVIISTDEMDETPMLLKIVTEANLSEKKIKFKFKTGKEKSEVQHATCSVLLSDGSKWQTQLNRTSYLIEARIKELEKGVNEGTSQSFLRGMTYKLFGALVAYGDKFRGMQHVVVGQEGYEAAAKVKFQTTSEDGTFFCSPYWIDSIAHLSGFVLNGSEATDSEQFVYISHGWESMRFLRPLQQNSTYRTYVRMMPEKNSTMMYGDVYVFDDDEAMGYIGGMSFQRIPRRQLNMLLPPSGKSSASRTAPPSKSASKLSKPAPEKSSPTPPEPDAEKTKVVGGEKIDQALKVIAEEAGVGKSDLTDEKEFSNLGIDSLLSLTILDSLRSDGLDLPSTIFTDCATIGEFRSYLSDQDESPSDPQSPPSASSSESTSSQYRGTSDDELGGITPATSVSDSNEDTETSDKSKISEALRPIISEEMGIPVDDLTDKTELTRLGLDSLMSLCILGNLKEAMGIDIQPDVFEGDPTLGEIEKRLGALLSTPQPSRRPSGIATPRKNSGVHTPRQSSRHPSRDPSRAPKLTRGKDNVAPQDEIYDHQKSAHTTSQPGPDASSKATSHLLQGTSTAKPPYLFLLPDGSGSATSYAALPNISPALTVYGLNCPYLRSPKSFTCGIDGVATQYLVELKRRQPEGPYLLGGWSAGGVIAFEMTRQLLEQGERVKQLLLIDAPCPLTIPPMPKSLVQFLSSIGIFSSETSKTNERRDGHAKPSEWLIAHFDASVANMGKYKPEPLPAGKEPPTTVIWAQDGVCSNKGDIRLSEEEVPDHPARKWMLDNRSDFGGNGWERLVGGEDKLTSKSVRGNHFTIMRQPNVDGVARSIRETILALT